MKAQKYDAALASLGVSGEHFDELKEPASINASITEAAQAAGIGVAPLCSCSLVNGDDIENDVIVRFY